MNKKALILIDFINDICHADGKVAGCAKMVNDTQVVKKVNNLLDYARTNAWLIVWIVVGFDKNYYSANMKSPIFSKAKQFGALQLGSWGTQLLADLTYNDGELIIYKNAISPFYETNLDHILRINDIEEVFLSGVSTEVAIQSCTRDAHDRGYKVNLLADCCASGNLDRHNASLEMLSYMANITSSSNVMVQSSS